MTSPKSPTSYPPLYFDFMLSIIKTGKACLPMSTKAEAKSIGARMSHFRRSLGPSCHPNFLNANFGTIQNPDGGFSFVGACPREVLIKVVAAPLVEVANPPQILLPQSPPPPLTYETWSAAVLPSLATPENWERHLMGLSLLLSSDDLP